MVIATSSVFTICDSANVRDGLLSILSSGLDRLWRPEFPSELATFVAIQLQIESFEVGDDFFLEIEITNVDGTPTDVPQFANNFSDVFSVEQPLPFNFPFVLDARALPLPAAQNYRMALKLNGLELSRYLFMAGVPDDAESSIEG